MTKFMAMMAGVAAPAAALAAGPLQIETAIKVERRVAPPGAPARTELAPATAVGPGDRTVILLRYRNTGALPLADVVLANPVPARMAYRGPAQGSPPPEVSIDGRGFGALASLRVAAGGGATRAATLDDVVAIRWRLASPVPAGAHGQLAFQAVVK